MGLFRSWLPGYPLDPGGCTGHSSRISVADCRVVSELTSSSGAPKDWGSHGLPWIVDVFWRFLTFFCRNAEKHSALQWSFFMGKMWKPYAIRHRFSAILPHCIPLLLAKLDLLVSFLKIHILPLRFRFPIGFKQSTSAFGGFMSKNMRPSILVLSTTQTQPIEGLASHVSALILNCLIK